MRKTPFLISASVAVFIGCTGGRVPPDEALLRVRQGYGEKAEKHRSLGAKSSADDWKQAARDLYPPAYYDYFEDMDATGASDAVGAKNLPLNPEERRGRNAWVLWTAGNEAFWDWLARNGYGSIDLLKLIDSNDRGRRFARTGLMTEPGTRPPNPDETRAAHHIRYDRPLKPEDALQPGQSVHVEYLEKNRERDDNNETHFRVYGYPSGVVGLRLYPNPEFVGEAKARWEAAHKDNPERFYQDQTYASRPDTIRPFRVGMSCGYCHIAPHPLRPPADPEFPEWRNLSNNIGNQFLRFRATFGNTLRPDNLLYHVLDAQLPGALDTSLIPSDNNNNPNTINSFFGLPGRLGRAKHNPKETIGADTFAYLDRYLTEPHVRELEVVNPKHVPRVLLDGSDSVGVHIALSRVYLNIGTHHQQWIRLHNPLLGFRPQKPFKLHDVAENSLYWHATLIRIDPMAAFFGVSTDPMRLKDVVLPVKAGQDPAQVELERRKVLSENLRGTGLPWYDAGDNSPPELKVGGAGDYAAGRAAFAKGCIACHSSVQPGDLPELEALVKCSCPPANRASLRLTPEDRLRLTRGDGTLPAAYAEWAKEAVKHRTFWEVKDATTGRTVHNYLSLDERVPVTVTHTNSGRGAATNALHGHIWEDFASQTYKELGSVGQVRYRDPFSGANKSYELPAGGPGFYRVPTLIGIWATAPFFHNNALGTFNNDPSVRGRLRSFDDSIGRLLWPERRSAPGEQHVWDSDKEPRKVYDGWFSGKRLMPGGAGNDLLDSDSRTKAADRLAADGGWVWRTTSASSLRFEGHHVPMLVGGAVGLSPEQMLLAPWAPSLALAAVGLALLMSNRLIARRERWEARIPILAPLFGPVRWVLAVGGFVAAVGSVALVLKYWPLIHLLDIGTKQSIWGFRVIAVAVPVLFFGSLGLLFSLSWLRGVAVAPGVPPEEHARLRAARSTRVARAAQFAGALCLVFAVVVAAGLGRFLAGQGAGVEIGPFPEGVPINAVVNFNPDAPWEQKIAAVGALADFFLEYDRAPADRKPGLEEFEARVAPALMNASKCPDLVTDRGHDYEFMRRLTDREKEELIALLKTF